MALNSPDLGRVRVQTARMLEIYALLRGELDGGAIRLTQQMREQLTQAIWTIAGNMQELQDYLAVATEDTSDTRAESSPDSASADRNRALSEALGQTAGSEENLDDLLETVLKWVTEMEEGG